MPFSISRLLSKPFENNNKSPEKDSLDNEVRLATSLGTSAYSHTAALYTYPLYTPGHVLRVPPQRAPLAWALPPLHHAALAHQAVKDRLAGEYTQNFR